TAFRAHVNAVEVGGIHSIGGIRLQHDPPDAAELRELARDLRAEERLHRLERVSHGDAQHFRLVAVEVDEELLRVRAERRRYALQLRALSRFFEKRLHHFSGLARVTRAAILDVELEAAGGAEA